MWFKNRRKTESLVRIDHGRVIDGFAQLQGFENYRPFDTYCGICDSRCHVTPAMQKYMLEVNRVPVKMLQRGAVYCESCRARRVSIKKLRKQPDRSVELERLEADENAARRPGARYERAEWPYGDGD